MNIEKFINLEISKFQDEAIYYETFIKQCIVRHKYLKSRLLHLKQRKKEYEYCIANLNNIKLKDHQFQKQIKYRLFGYTLIVLLNLFAYGYGLYKIILGSSKFYVSSTEFSVWAFWCPITIISIIVFIAIIIKVANQYFEVHIKYNMYLKSERIDSCVALCMASLLVAFNPIMMPYVMHRLLLVNHYAICVTKIKKNIIKIQSLYF